MTTITLEFNDDEGWVIELNGMDNGSLRNGTYTNQGNIKKLIQSLDSPLEVYKGDNDMKLHYDDCDVVIKDYKELSENDLFNIIVSKFSLKTKIQNVLYTNTKKLASIPKKVLTKKNMAITAGAAVIATGIWLYLNSDKPIEPVVVEPEVIETEYTVEEEQDINEDIKDEQFGQQEQELDFNKSMSLEVRIGEVESIKEEQNISFNVCSELNEYALNRFKSYIEKNEEMLISTLLNYGVDPYLLLAISMAESSLSHYDTIPGGSRYNEAATGIMQIENANIGLTVTSYNYQTMQYDSIEITQDKLNDLNYNTQIGAMLLQNSLEKYGNNVYIAIQAYNYGAPVMDMVIEKYAYETGKTFEEVVSNVEDFGWLKYVDDVHYNPQKYISKWGQSTYGNNEYISSVLSYYIGQNIVNRYGDDYYVYDLKTKTCTIKCDNTQIQKDNFEDRKLSIN